MHRNPTLFVASMLALALCAGDAMAQTLPPPDTLKVEYFANAQTAGAPSATLRLTNPGTNGTNICAAIYVFNQVEEMSECCSCELSPNDLRTLSVNTDLTNNPLTGIVVHTGTISIVSTATVEGGCPTPVNLTPTSGGVRAWATHIEQVSSIPPLAADFVLGGVTAAQDATLSPYEENQLELICDIIALDGSRAGICTCGTGD